MEPMKGLQTQASFRFQLPAALPEARGEALLKRGSHAAPDMRGDHTSLLPVSSVPFFTIEHVWFGPVCF